MAPSLRCPHCGQTVAVAATPGRQVRCASCNTALLIPDGAGAESAGVARTLDYATAAAAPRTGLATAALVVGILALPADCVFIGPLLGIIAVVLGVVALVRARRRPAHHAGKGMAIAGICCGGASILVIPPVAVSILLPSLPRARELARRAVCAAQLRGIGRSCRIYAHDNGQCFPPDLRTLVERGQTTLAELQCPSEPNSSQAVFDHVYIPEIRATAPPGWIIAYEDPANHGGEGGNIL